MSHEGHGLFVGRWRGLARILGMGHGRGQVFAASASACRGRRFGFSVGGGKRSGHGGQRQFFLVVPVFRVIHVARVVRPSRVLSCIGVPRGEILEAGRFGILAVRGNGGVRWFGGGDIACRGRNSGQRVRLVGIGRSGARRVLFGGFGARKRRIVFPGDG